MKKKECKSIYDLAEITGVSYATVSRVLNNRGRTAEATRKTILKAVSDYNFRPRMKARKLTIGIIMGFDQVIDTGMYGYTETILIQLLNDLSNKGYSIEIFTPHNLNNLKNCLLDGLITMMWNDLLAYTIGQTSNLPVVIINSESVPGYSQVYSDHEQGGRMAAEYLLERGHTRAGIILNNRSWGNSLRANGFCQEFAEKGVGRESVFVGFISEQSETVLIKNMLSAEPSAVFIASEDKIIQSLGAIQALNNESRNPLTVISMENPSLSRYLNPPMTTIAQPFGEIIRKSIDIISEQIDKRTNEPQECKLNNTLIIRGN